MFIAKYVRSMDWLHGLKTACFVVEDSMLVELSLKTSCVLVTEQVKRLLRVLRASR